VEDLEGPPVAFEIHYALDGFVLQVLEEDGKR
jgi:hypothetical protein